jgi:uncharacterized membrane protein YobD (UPF0266 family)
MGGADMKILLILAIIALVVFAFYEWYCMKEDNK